MILNEGKKDNCHILRNQSDDYYFQIQNKEKNIRDECLIRNKIITAMNT